MENWWLQNRPMPEERKEEREAEDGGRMKAKRRKNNAERSVRYSWEWPCT